MNTVPSPLAGARAVSRLEPGSSGSPSTDVDGRTGPNDDPPMPRRAAVLALLSCGLITGGCGGERAAKPVAKANCEPIYYAGKVTPDALIVSDLPRKGE